MTEKHQPDEDEVLAAEALIAFEEGGHVALEELLARHPERAAEVRRAVEGAMAFDAALEPETRLATPGELALGAESHRGLARGTRLGDFVLEDEIGRGGMGIVYRARQRRLLRDVALKVLPPEFGTTQERVQRFVREARICARISHPGVVVVYDAGNDHGQCFLAMELVEGETLAEVQDRGLLTIPWAVEIGRQVADALAAAHEAGLLHRDVKPGNIMLSGATAKLMDFGLALDQSEEAATLTRPGVLMGTPAYMAPEQLTGRSQLLDGRTDVYALGVVLYQGLTGELPYEADVTTALLREIKETPPLPPRRRGARLPRDLETILLRCLEKNPDRRYQSAAELRDDLDRFGRGEPIRARPIPRVVAAVRWIARHPTRTTILAGAAGLLVLATYLGSAVGASARMSDLERDLEAGIERERDLSSQLERLAGELARAREDGGAREATLSGELTSIREELIRSGERARELESALADASEELARLRRRELALLAESSPAPAVEAPREKPVAGGAVDRPGVRGAELARACSRAREAAEGLDFARALEGLTPVLARAGDVPEVVAARELEAILAASSRAMARVLDGVEGSLGERVTVTTASGAEISGTILELDRRAGGSFWLGIEGGGRAKVLLRNLPASELLRWAGADAPVEERIGVLLARDEVGAAAELAREHAPDTPLGQTALARERSRRCAGLATAFPRAGISLDEEDVLRLTWELGDWRQADGALRGRTPLELWLAIPASARPRFGLELASPAPIEVAMGEEPLRIEGAAGEEVVAERVGDVLRCGSRSSSVTSPFLSVAADDEHPGDLELSRLWVELAVGEGWWDSMLEPRRALAEWDWSEGETSGWGEMSSILRADGGRPRALVLRSERVRRRPPPPPPRRGGEERPRPPPRRHDDEDAPHRISASAQLDADIDGGARLEIRMRAVSATRADSMVVTLQGADGLTLGVVTVSAPGGTTEEMLLPLAAFTAEAGMLDGKRIERIGVELEGEQAFQIAFERIALTVPSSEAR
jgi:hypothetical protein